MKEKKNTKTNKQQKQKQRDDKQLFPGARFRLKKSSGFLLITQVFCFSIGAVQRIL